MKALMPIKLEGDAERVRSNMAEAIVELQRVPLVGARVVKDITLEDGVATPVAHGLGRAPNCMLLSPPRGPVTSGHIEEIRGTHDRGRAIVLQATGFGGPIVVDGVFL
jgi:hypothetical protein